MNKMRVDFQNCDIKGRVRLNTVGVLRSLQEQNARLEAGMEVILSGSDEELLAIGKVEFSADEDIWVAKYELIDK